MKQPVNISPGPWHVSAGLAPDSNGRLIVESYHGLPVCATSLRGVQGRHKCMAANAALIAAAPEMFDALSAALEWAENYAVAYSEMETWRRREEWRRKASDALWLARGEVQK